jgi:hypothetical protein
MDNATTAGAALEVLVVNARDCQIELKVRPGSDKAMRSCDVYLARRDAWWAPAIAELSSLMKDQSWSRSHAALFTKATDAIDKINDAHAFIKLQMGIGR